MPVDASRLGPFPRSQRVRKRPEFQDIQTTGQRVTTRHFVLLLKAQSTPPGPPRLGITVSRKVGSAVVRNRAKRLVRAAFRATQPLWEPGIDLVVIVRSPLEGMKHPDVVREWQGAASHIRRRMEAARRDAQAETVGPVPRRTT